MPLVLFWSAVLSFIPTTLYLLLKNPPIYRAEAILAKRIFIIGQDSELKRGKKSRVRTVVLIYVFCFSAVFSVLVVNVVNGDHGVNPFDILSAFSVMFFWLSVLSYLPMALYLILRNPWQYKEEGVCLTTIYIFYGIGVLIFSLVFAFHWLKSRYWILTAGDIFSSLLIILFGAAVLSYLPILIYVYLRTVRPCKQGPAHPNTVFVIYSLCFLLFSSIYLINWVGDKRAGVQYKSWVELLRF